MYIAIIMRQIDSGNTIQYSSIDMFDEDMRNWKHILWAYLYEKETGKEVRRHLTSSSSRAAENVSLCKCREPNEICKLHGDWPI